MPNYYDNQLNRLIKDSDHAIKVQFIDVQGNKTNFLSLNKESIKSINNFLNDLIYLSNEEDTPVDVADSAGLK